ncbi:MAG: fasciclin domain-containing protein [Bacteroidaceae bacterium]|nr:fasciclin domain-containing protein [Bacteroidaceae bacterium]
MQSKRFLKLIALGLLAFPVVFCSCDDEMTDDPHYKPQVRTGSAYQQLEKAGNYTIFLEGADLAGLTPILDGKSLMTVMAPDDAAFQKYLEEKGYSSIKAMYDEDPQQVNRLIGFHMVRYAYDWKKFVNFDPQNGDAGPDPDEFVFMEGLYYKHRTYSTSPMTVEYDPALQKEVKVYHFDRLIPVFSNKMFETLGLDPAYNYEYFYPNTEWRGSRGSNGGFNIANAAVLDSANVITDNGYLYHVDQVLDPIESLYETLKQDENYSKYVTLYDQYSSYQEDPDLSLDYGNGDKVYLHLHNGTISLPNIATEWYLPDELNYAYNSRATYNIFAPSNEAVDKLFTDFWKEGCGYDRFEELDPLIQKYFIMQTFAYSFYDATLGPVFPEMIKEGEVITDFGTVLNIDPDEVTDRKICTNGFLYGMDEMEVPVIFSSVVAPAFSNAAYLNHLYALDVSGLITSLASEDMKFVAMIPDTVKYRVANMPIQKLGNAKVIKEWDDVNGVYSDMSPSTAQDIVNMHIVPNISELPTEGVEVLETSVPFNYWYVKDGKEITTNYMFNQYLSPEYSGNPFVSFEPLYDAFNGKAYTYGGETLFRAGTGDGLEHTLSICNDPTYPYYLFSQLLQKSGLAVEGLLPTIVAPDSRFIVFVPTNEALKNAMKELPGCAGLKVADDYRLSGSNLNSTNKNKLAAYLRSYFITSTLTPFAKYPYPGAGIKGEFVTFGDYKLNVIDNGKGNDLQVNFVGGESTTPVKVVGEYGYLPFAYSDGCFHFIEDVLK